jgi:ketosteroid isomerase-like protein
MPATTQLEAAVQLLLDKQAIHDVLQRYCRGVDRSDEELLRSVYHSDAYDDHGGFKGNGWEFAAGLVERMRAAGQPTMHTLSNESIDIDGDVAYVESYVIAYHRHLQDGVPSDLFFGGRYVDRFERRNGEWRIAHRTVVHDFSHEGTAPEPAPMSVWFTQGVRSHEDPSYQR